MASPGTRTVETGGVGYENGGPPFSRAEYDERLRRVRERMARGGLDLLYVTSPEGMCYLHGMQTVWYGAQSPKEWTTIAGTAVCVDHDRLVHFENPEEVGTLERTSIAEDVRFFPGSDRGDGMVVDGQIDFLVGELKQAGWTAGKKVGLELWGYKPNPAVSERLARAFAAAGATVVDGSDVLREVKRVKSPAEIACVEEAARIADVGITAVAEMLAPGVTELEIYGELVRAMAAAGGELPAIVQTVQVGPEPYRYGHGMATRRAIGAGEAVSLFACGVFNRYHANVTRGIWLGEPPAEVVDRFEKSGKAFPLICEAGRAGTPIADFNRTLREYFVEAGLWDSPRDFVGGYELGLSFPPDWVGPFIYSIEEEDAPGALEDGLVAMFDAAFYPGNQVDTVVFGTRTRTLSTLAPTLIVVDC